MAGARQNNGQEAMVSILRKLETMLEMTNEVYDETLTILSSTEAIMKNEVSVELKKQTTILMSIESKLQKASEEAEKSKKDKFDDKEMMSMSKSLTQIIKAVDNIDEKSGDKVKKFLMSISDGFKYLTENVDKETAKAIGDVVMGLGKSVLAFAFWTALATPLLILALPGAILFGLTIRLLMKTAGVVDKETVQGITAIVGLSKSIVLFGLSMVVFAIISPIVLIGSLAFGLSIRLLLFAAGTANKEGVEAMKAPLKIALGVLLYSLTMLAVSLIAPQVLIGTLIISLSIVVLSLALFMIGSDRVRKGIGSLALASLSIILYGLTVLAFNASVNAEQVLFTMLAVAGIALVFWVVGKAALTIAEGALALGIASIAVILLSIGLLIFKKTEFGWEDSAILGVVIVGLGAAMFGAGLLASEIILGSLAMVAASFALIFISVGLLVYKATKFEWEDAAILGAVVVGLGTAMGLAGVASPLILAGSAAMLVAGVALMSISAGLAIFKASGFTEEDGKSLKSAIGAVITGFLGGEMPGGLIDGLKFAAQAAARAALLFVTVPPLILAGAALISISTGLSQFKKIGWTPSDSEAMESSIGSIIKAFSLLGDKKRQQELGIDVNWVDMSFGINALANAGTTLSNLAKGIQAFANMEVIEYEVVNPGTKDAKIVPKSVRKLTEADFTNAASGMAKVITAIAEPFALVGKANKGESTGSLYDAIFGGGYVSDGIDALKNSGDTLVNLAKGVQAFANLEIIEYEVINPGTKDAKIVPKSVRKLSETDFTNASKNISTVLGFLVNELAKIGKMEAESSGWFSDGAVTKGKEAIAGIAGDIYMLADTVIKMANSEITEYEVKDGKLVPKSVRKMNETDFTNARNNIQKIMTSLVNGLVDVGKIVEESEDEIDSALEYIPDMTKALADSAKPIEAWAKLNNIDTTAQSISTFFKTISSTFDPSINPNVGLSSALFTSYANNVQKIANPSNNLDKFANNVGKIEKSMKLLKEHINNMDLKKLTLTDSLLKSIALLSKNPDAIARAIEGSIEKSFEELIDALKELIETPTPTATTAATAPTTGPVTATPTSTAINQGQKPQQMDSRALVTALEDALSSTTIKVNVQNLSDFPK